MSVDDDYKKMFPKLFFGARKSGKTMALLKLANETGVPILAPTQMVKSYLLDEAKRLGHENVKVVTFHNLKRDGVNVDRVIVDNAEMILRDLLRVKVEAMSITTYDAIDLGSTKPFEVE